jgi:hypothetical protein
MVANSYIVSTSADVCKKDLSNVTAVTFKMYQIINFHALSTETKSRIGNLIRFAELNKIYNGVFSGDQPYQCEVSVRFFTTVSIITPDNRNGCSL